MCGRFTQHADAATITRVFEAEVKPALEPRYNIAPTQPAPVVRAWRSKSQGTARRELDLVRWGLVPSWAKADDVTGIGSRMINARSETVASKPAYRAAFKYRRCIVPADGFYEWQVVGETDRGKAVKQPHLIYLADEQPFGFAGLWEHWQDAAGNELETCAILTTAANEMMRELHDRMPVILDREDYARWLDPANDTGAGLEDLLRPFPAELMAHHPVAKRVGSPRHDDAELLKPLAPVGPPPSDGDTADGPGLFG